MDSTPPHFEDSRKLLLDVQGMRVDGFSLLRISSAVSYVAEAQAQTAGPHPAHGTGFNFNQHQNLSNSGECFKLWRGVSQEVLFP